MSRENTGKKEEEESRCRRKEMSRYREEKQGRRSMERKQGNIQQKRKADASERAVVRCNGNHQKSEDTRRKEQQKRSTAARE